MCFGSGNSSVVRAPDSQEWRANFLLQGQLSVLSLIWVSVPLPRYRSCTDPGHSAKSAGGRLSLKHACILNPFLTNVCSPNILRTGSTNYDSFLTWTFSSPNMVRTVRRTLLRSQLACNEMQASARTCGQTRSRQHDRKCRLKSSHYTLIISHRVIQPTTISFWVPETWLRLPQVNK